jgi:uncharacterized protein YdaU (DUF1376 family)
MDAPAPAEGSKMTERVRSDGYYRWFPGDYLRDTGTLSLIEHGAYRLLLDHYYSESGNISDEKPRLYRLCRATTPEEQQAVDFIVRKYFPIKNGLLTNNRADRELLEREIFIEEQRRKGKLGGRPPKKAEEKPGDNPGVSPGFEKQKPKESPASASASASRSSSGSGSKVKVESVVPSGEKPPSVTSLTKHFVKPTLEQVTAYCAERKNRIDPQLFIDSNDAKGWVVGTTKTPMKDWRATIRTWEKRNGSGDERDTRSIRREGHISAPPGKYAGIGTVVHTDPGAAGKAGSEPAPAASRLGGSAGAVS